MSRKRTKVSRYLTKGFIQIPRELFYHSLSPHSQDRAFTEYEAYIDLYVIANYFPTPMGRLKVKRSEVVRTNKELADRWNWTKEEVEVFKTKLVNLNEVKIHKAGNSTVVITLLKYEEYQGEYKVDYDNHENTVAPRKSNDFKL